MNQKVRSESEINRLFEMYLPKLTRLAESRLSDKLGQKLDGDDVAGTVCRTVWRRFLEGKFDFDDDAGFWRLLVTIAIRKISNKARHFNTQSRSIENEVPEVAKEIVRSPEPGPAEAAAFAESLQSLISLLDKQEHEIFLMRIQNYQFQEIADELKIAERTARRKMDVIKEKLNEVFDQAAAD